MLTTLASPASAATDRIPLISVTGEARVSATPDIAIIEAGVTTQAKSASETSDSNNAAMGKVLLALKAAGIPEKNIQTQRLSLQPQYTANLAGPNVVTGYRASNRVSIKLRDITEVAATIDLLVGAGANEIGGVHFMVEAASKLLDDARTQAIADARRKAEIYARAAGVALGSPISISEESASGPLMLRRNMAGTLAAPAPVLPGEETLGVSVAVSWLIKPLAAPASPPVPPAAIPNAPAPGAKAE